LYEEAGMPDQSRLDHFLIPELIERVEINRTRPVIQAVVSTWRGANLQQVYRVGIRSVGFMGYGSLFTDTLWKNGYNKSVDGKLRNELLDGEPFTPSLEVQILIENYNQFGPHSSLNYRHPALEAIHIL
jgi:hypothetical protein